MRGLIAGLLVVLVIVILALLVATVAALGIASIGWLLSRWFELTQWQGSLIALAVGLGAGFVAYRLASASDIREEPEWIEWQEGDREDVEVVEPPIVPWRRQRPTQGNLPSGSRMQKRGSRRK